MKCAIISCPLGVRQIKRSRNQELYNGEIWECVSDLDPDTRHIRFVSNLDQGMSVFVSDCRLQLVSGRLHPHCLQCILFLIRCITHKCSAVYCKVINYITEYCIVYNCIGYQNILSNEKYYSATLPDIWLHYSLVMCSILLVSKVQYRVVLSYLVLL